MPLRVFSFADFQILLDSGASLGKKVKVRLVATSSIFLLRFDVHLFSISVCCKFLSDSVKITAYSVGMPISR